MASTLITNWTPQQIERVRYALESYRTYGGGIPGKKLSWAAIVGKMELYTGYVIDPANEASQLKNDAEALRQFASGKSPSAGRKTRVVSERLLTALTDFLRHPEIGLLSDDALADADADMVLAIRLRNYFLYPHQVSKVASHAETLPMAIAGVGRAHIPSVKDYILSRHSLNNGYKCRIKREESVLSHLWVFLLKTDEPAIFLAECLAATPLYWGVGSDERRAETLKHRSTGFAVFKSGLSAELFLTDTQTSEPRMMSIAFRRSASEISVVALDMSGVRRITEDTDNVVPLVAPSDTSRIEQISGSLPTFSDRHGGVAFKLRPVEDDYLSNGLDGDLLHLMKKCEAEADVGVYSSRQFHAQIVQQIRDQKWMEEHSRRLFRDIWDQYPVDIQRRLDEGARLDYVDPETGQTAIHVLAHLGKRNYLRVAFQNKAKCDFSIRDRKGQLASAHAFVYAWDRPLARLLMKYEVEAGVVLPGSPATTPNTESPSPD